MHRGNACAIHPDAPAGHGTISAMTHGTRAILRGTGVLSAKQITNKNNSLRIILHVLPPLDIIWPARLPPVRFARPVSPKSWRAAQPRQAPAPNAIDSCVRWP